MAEDLLQELLDREKIKELRYKIAQSLDRRDWALFESLVTDEVDTDFSALGIPVQRAGRAAFVGSFRQNLGREGLQTQHIYSNFRITLQGDRATSRFHQFAQHYLDGPDGPEEFILRGEYIDELVRTPDGWKLSGVTFLPLYFSGNPALLAGA